MIDIKIGRGESILFVKSINHLQMDSCREREVHARAESLKGLMWNDKGESAKKPLLDLDSVIDIKTLTALGTTHEVNRTIALTFISQEYAQVGLNWIEAMRRIGWRNYLVIAGDAATHQVLSALSVPCVESRMEISRNDPAYVSPGGFTLKGLAITAMKFPIVHRLLRLGLNVFFSDVDAIWLKDPMTVINDLNADCMFQRVVYFPRAIARIWGFAACSGFVFFRSSAGTIALLEECIAEHREVQDDQVAMNLAFMSADTNWNLDECCSNSGRKRTNEELIDAFKLVGRRPIRGTMRSLGLDVVALPHHQFWRHNWFAAAQSEMVVCHPNTPKSNKAKKECFKNLGMWYV